MIKKILLLFSAIIMVSSLIACGDNAGIKSDTTTTGIPSGSETTSFESESESTAAEVLTIERYKIGETAKADLDGDGNADEVCVGVETVTHSEGEFSYDEIRFSKIDINGKNMIDPSKENPFERFDIWYENPDTEFYYITDIDINDGKKEIALVDYGSNDWTVTTFFRYENGDIKYIKFIEGMPYDSYFELPGDGTASSMIHLSLLQTWRGVAKYELDANGEIVLSKGQLIEPAKNDYVKPVIVKDLTVFAEMDKASETSVISGDGDFAYFPLTDNEHWVKIETAAGKTGWIYLEGWTQIDNGGKIMESSEIFDGLLFAG